MRTIRVRVPSPALLVACVALFAALGGTTYAAATAGSTIHFSNATLRNGWKPGGYGSANPGYGKDSSGIVHLRGSVKGGTTSSVAFVLPTGLRPKHDMWLPIYTLSGTEGSLTIYSNGDVWPSGADAGGYSSLDGVSFVAGQ